MRVEYNPFKRLQRVEASPGGGGPIADNSVTNSKLSDMASARIKGRITAGFGDPEDLTATQVRSILNVADGANNYAHPNHSGDVTSIGDGTTAIVNNAITTSKIENNAVTLAKLATIAADTLLANFTGSTAVPSAVPYSDLLTKIKTSFVFPIIQFAASDESTALTTGTDKAKLHAAAAMRITKIKCALNSASTGSDLVVDIQKNGTTIATVTVTAGQTIGNDTTFVSDTFAEDDIITCDIVSVGTGATGLKVYIIGYLT